MIYFGLEVDSLCDCSQIMPVFAWAGWGGKADLMLFGTNS